MEKNVLSNICILVAKLPYIMKLPIKKLEGKLIHDWLYQGGSSSVQQTNPDSNILEKPEKVGFLIPR